jgi:site-specific DNA recombinase
MEIWEATVRLLKGNQVSRKTRHNLPSGRMLQGRLMTSKGKIYTPTHANKRGRRYFYYMLRGESESNAIKSLPAVEIESRVLCSISSFLADSIRVADRSPGLDVRDMKLLMSAARHRSTLLIEGSVKEKSELVSRMVARVNAFCGKMPRPSSLRL